VTAPSLSVPDIAGRTALSEKAVRSAIARGELTAYKLAGKLRVTEDDYAAWVESCRVRPDAPSEPPPPAALADGGGLRRLLAHPDQGGGA
jgi:hypothetical protein